MKKANWDIAKTFCWRSGSSQPSAFKAKLKSILWKMRVSYMTIKVLDFTLCLTESITKVRRFYSGSFRFIYTYWCFQSGYGIWRTYIYLQSRKPRLMRILIWIWKISSSLSKTIKFIWNALDLGVNGWVAMPDTNIDMIWNLLLNLTFKNFISMIPAVYSGDFKNLTSSGKMSLSGYKREIQCFFHARIRNDVEYW